jgi:hypothetical protein
VTARTALRVAVLSATTALLSLPASPVLAATLVAGRDDGEEPGSGLSALQTIGIFVGIPVALFLFIALLVAAPGAARGPRYRPGVGWWAAPVWFNGPDQVESAVQRDVTAATTEGGGASARW